MAHGPGGRLPGQRRHQDGGLLIGAPVLCTGLGAVGLYDVLGQGYDSGGGNPGDLVDVLHDRHQRNSPKEANSYKDLRAHLGKQVKYTHFGLPYENWLLLYPVVQGVDFHCGVDDQIGTVYVAVVTDANILHS